MPAVDYFHRRNAVAHAILAVIRREKPDAVRQLIDSVGKVFGFDEGTTIVNAQTHRVIAAWCRHLNLDSNAIKDAAFTLGLTGQLPGDAPASQGDSESDYVISWQPGESQRSFLRRALVVFLERKAVEGEVASDRIDGRHVEWFVRFHVGGEPYDRIARSERADRSDVKRAIRQIASLLQLQLRQTALGRPRGSGHPKTPAKHIVRRKSRR